jgi:hypothetical protein
MPAGHPAELATSLGGVGMYKLEVAQNFVVSAVVGAVLMTLLKWKYRFLAIVAYPAFIMFWFPYQVSRQAGVAFGPDYTFASYFWNHLPFFGAFLVGASLGAGVAWTLKRRSIPAPPNNPLDRSRPW